MSILAVDQPSEKRSVRIIDKKMWAAWGLKDMVSSRLGGFFDTKIVIVQSKGFIGQLLDLNIGALDCSHKVSRHCCRAKWLHDVHVPASYCFYPGPILGLDRDMY